MEQPIPPIGGKPIFNKTLFSKGLISLANILNTGSLKPWTFSKAERLNFNDYSLLFGLFNSIPLAWKKLTLQLTLQMTL